MSALRDTLLLPLWLGQVLAGTKSFERNPLIRGRWLNEHGLHTARVALAHRIAQARRERLAPQVSAEDRAAFARDGFVLKHDFVPPQLFQEVPKNRGQPPRPQALRQEALGGTFYDLASTPES